MKKSLVSAVLATMLVGGVLSVEAAFENKTFSGNGIDTLATDSYNTVILNNVAGTTHIVNAGAPGGTLLDSQLSIVDLKVVDGKGVMNFYLDDTQTLEGLTNQILTRGYANGGTTALVNDRVVSEKEMEITGGAVSFIGGFDNSGTLRIATDAQAMISNYVSDTYATIDNSGNISVQGYAAIVAYADNVTYMPYENVAIENEGVMDVGTEAGSVVYIDGIVRNYGTDAKTHIVLNKYNDYFTSVFTGKVENSDVGEFSLTVNEGAYWCPYNQTEEVYGVTLNSGNVSLTGSFGSFQTLKLRNLNATGVPTFTFMTNLLGNEGDTMILNGTTPNVKFNVNVTDQNVMSHNSVKKEDGYKVVLITAPDDTQMKLNKALALCDYDQGTKIVQATIEEEVGDGIKTWSLVGWTQRPRGDDKSTAKDALDVPNLMPEMEEKRLEEIHRYAVHKDLSELGAWVRGETGKMSADGVDFDVKVISGGYDWNNKTSKGNFFMGVGVSHGTSNADMNFVGDSKNTSFSVYGSWYGRKNYDYIDFVAKYGKIDHQYNGINFDDVPCSGEYDKNMYSFFAKYGRRLPLKNGFYIEPFGSVTYGHIGDADFYDNGQGAHMHVNSILSKILSVGAMFGRSVKGTELYCKLAYSYDFDGEIRGSVPEQNYSEKTDMGGSSYKFAVGASRNLGKQNSLHLDLEKDFGGKMKRPWNLALTFKHTW